MTNPIDKVLDFDTETVPVGPEDTIEAPKCPVGAESVWDHASNQAPVRPELWAVYAPNKDMSAVLYEHEPGTYLAFADANNMALLDPGDTGVPLSDYDGDWQWYSMDGDEDDPEKPGQQRAVTDRIVNLGKGKKPPTDVIPGKPYDVDKAQGLTATRLTPSIPCTVAGLPDLRLIAEKRTPKRNGQPME